jgi:MOSC domain-containing protein YiiM
MSGDPTVVGIQIALAARLPMRSVERIDVEAGAGIVGDRYHGTRHRHLTVQSLEEIARAEEEIGHSLDAVLTRRNVTVSHGDLPRTPGTRLRLGDVELEVVRDCAPCKLLEDDLGRNAKLALHKRAGVVCRALSSGSIELGAQLEVEEPAALE